MQRIVDEALPLQNGDLIFTATDNPLYRRVAAATGSRASHVGIAFTDAAGRWMVAESTFPVSRYTPLAAFLARSEAGWTTIRRLRGGLDPTQQHALRLACERRMGRFYHLGFRYHSRRQFCSKFVFDAYREAIGCDIGQLESFHTLLQRQPATALGFWRCWYFGFIPWSRITITPASQLNSPRLVTVLERH